MRFSSPSEIPRRSLCWPSFGATREDRILVTIDTDFGRMVHGGAKHAGLLRLPDVPAAARIELLADVLRRHGEELSSHSVITVKNGRIRISRNL
jgi:predicted nuclease of predicted toxin-antitoxin system